MYEALTIHSRFREYAARFTRDIPAVLSELRDKGNFFLVDRNVARLHASILDGALPPERTLFIEVNEQNKSMGFCQELIEELVNRNIRRNLGIVAIGGGIVQDISSFISSILYRGISWSFIPTTLLAQADSCIGSKTSINLGDKKNLVGNFYPPEHVYINVDFLESLSVADLKSGIGEILHYYIYAASPLVQPLMENYEKIIENPRLLAEHIRASLAIKKSVIEIDEFDQGERNKFNYGHTFGHALETLTNYKLSHGQAVTLGMDIANFLSTRLGFMDDATYEELRGIFFKNMPNFDMTCYSLETYFGALARDKKNVGNNLGCILAVKSGELFKKQIPFDRELKNIISEYFAQ